MTGNFDAFSPDPKYISNLLNIQKKLAGFNRVYFNKEPDINPNLPWIVFVFAPSGTGKGTVMEPLKQSGLVQFAKTAINRSVRPNESEDSHIWMRQPYESEQPAEYKNNLITEYDLIESDEHNGNIYGLPKFSLKTALGKGQVVLMECDINGVKTLQEKCKSLANTLAVFLVPDSFAQLWNRMGDRDNKEARLAKALDEFREAPKVANFFIHNSEIPDNENGKTGLEVARDSLIALVKKYCLVENPSEINPV